MAVDAGIPLAFRPQQDLAYFRQAPDIREQMTLREMARQMQVRNQVQQIQGQPGMFEGSIPTDKYITSLRNIDASLAEKVTMDRSALLAEQSLERQRAASAHEKMIQERTDELDEEYAGALSKYYSAGGDEASKRKAIAQHMSEVIERWKASGKLSKYEMTPEMVAKVVGQTSPDEIQAALLNHKKKDVVEGITYKADLDREKQGKPGEVSLSDIDKVVSKPMEEKGLQEGTPLEGPQDKQVEPGVRERTERLPGMEVEQPKVAGLEPREVKADKPETTVEGLYERAEEFDRKADKAQSGKRQKELREEADRLRKRAEGLDRSIDRERRTDQADERLKLAVQRIANTQSPLDPANVKLLGEAVAKGNYAIAAGLARNQVAQKQLKDAVGDYARSHGWSADDLNRAHMKFSGAMKAQAGFMAGPEARNVTAINTAIGHMGTMSNLADALASSDSQAINAAVNAIANQFGDPSITNFEVAKSAVSNELMRVFRQVGASETEVQEWEKKFKASQTPDQIRGSLNVAADLLDSRIKNLGRQAERAGIDVPDIVSPESEESLSKIRGKARRGVSRGEFQRAEPIKPYDDAEKERRYQEYKKKHGY